MPSHGMRLRIREITVECRFTGFVDLLCEGKGGHCVDERFAVSTLDTSAKLFYRFLRECRDSRRE